MVVLISLVLLVTFIACITDLRGLRIPNSIPALIMGLFLIYVGYGLLNGIELRSFYGSFIAGGGVFVLTFFFFALNIFGAGDAKLASALSFWLGLKGVFAFLMVMAFTGGGLGVVALIVMKRGVPLSWQKGWLKALSEGRADVPYALAIFAGAVAGFMHAGMLYKNYPQLRNIKSNH